MSWVSRGVTLEKTLGGESNSQRFVVFTTFLTGSPFNQKVVLISLTWMMLSYAKLGKQGRLVLNIIVVFDTKIKEYKSLMIMNPITHEIMPPVWNY